jgi:hypothetical protein
MTERAAVPRDGNANMPAVLLLFPADPLAPRRPDEDIAAEAGAALPSGLDLASSTTTR